jgi:hypothetical protein
VTRFCRARQTGGSLQLIEQLTAMCSRRRAYFVPLLQDSMESDAKEQLYSEYIIGE